MPGGRNRVSKLWAPEASPYPVPVWYQVVWHPRGQESKEVTLGSTNDTKKRMMYSLWLIEQSK